MIFWLLVLVVLGFSAYSVYAYYGTTNPGDSIPKRFWASIVAAAGALGALVMSWFQGGATPS